MNRPTEPDVLPHAMKPDTWSMARSHAVFSGVAPEDVQCVMPFFRMVTAHEGEVVMSEGLASSSDLYLILSGELEVIKHGNKDAAANMPDVTPQFVIAQLQAGDTFGELSFINGEPRSASIRSRTRSSMLALNPSQFAMLETEHPAVASRIMKNLVAYIGSRLKRTTESEVRALKVELHNSNLKSKANLFFSYVIGLLCVYNLTLHFTSNIARDADSTSYISAAIIGVFSFVLVLMIIQSQQPLHLFGLTPKNLKPALRESLLWSVFIIAAMIFCKWVLILQVPRFQHLPLFDFDPTHDILGINFLLYTLHCPIQEFVARGVLQGSLQRYFTGNHVNMRAILVSNALFAATHVHVMEGLLGIIVFIPGLFWGWLYTRHQNLAGVSVSHILIGWTGLFFLNLESLFR